jgi:type II secretory pathway component PulM
MLTIWRNAAKQKFDQLSASDQRAVLIMLAAIISAVVYLSLSLSSGYQKSAVSRYERALQDSRWLDTNQAKLLELASAKKKLLEKSSSNEESSLINMVSVSAKPFGIAFKRFQPQDENGLRLWIEGAEFDMLMRWLAALDQKNIKLNQLEIGRQEKQPGLAEARVLVSMP